MTADPHDPTVPASSEDVEQPEPQLEAGHPEPAAEPQPEAEPTPDSEDPLEDPLVAALAEAERSRDEYLDHLRRERAEFDNYRRRATRERMDALDRGAQQLVTDLLGVLDNFGFALRAATERDPSDQLAKGVQMVHGQLLDVLRRAGLEDVDGPGAVFDPNHHEAMMQVAAADDEAADQQPAPNGDPVEREPVVVEVLRPGYRFKGRVLRPASVKVAR
ncbi:MAG: nucleotide exchange factor GrpE [Actinomycetota bacterium]|jgi:molecular chaperone GrpE|nr:nucleotide exchange factor GrpE [Actinomycetota bacterium]